MPGSILTAAALSLVSLVPPDDTCATADWATVTAGAFSSRPNRSLGPGDPVDHYRMRLDPGVEAEIILTFLHADGDIDLRLWNADCTVLLAESRTSTDDESLFWLNTGNAGVEIVAEVFFGTAPTGNVTYRFSTRGTFVTCDFEDEWEDNESCSTATPRPFEEIGRDYATITLADDDYYAVVVPPVREMNVRIQFAAALYDIDARVIDSDCVTVLETSSTSSFEDLTLRNPTQQSRTLYVHVYRVDADPGCSPYIMYRSGQLGIGSCTAAPTSLGVPAELIAYGSTSVVENDLNLFVYPLPEFAFGLAVYSDSTQSFPLGNGTLCVGPTFVRSPVIQAQPDFFDAHIDFGQYASTPIPFVAGGTYHFQTWFRDVPTGGFGFGLSDAYSVVLTP